MTTSSPLPAHTRLPPIDPEQAQAQSALIEALNRRRAGALLLSAQITKQDASVPAWIALDSTGHGTLHIAPLLADGAVPALSDATGRPDAAAAAVALGAIEPVVAAIELVTGRTLRPVAVADQARGAATIRVEAHAGTALVHRALLTVPAGLRLDGVSLPLDPSAFVDVAPAWAARIGGPELSPARLAEIGTGDLLLLGTAGDLARFTPPGRDTPLVGRLDVGGGTMTVEGELEPETRAQATPDLAALTVPTTLEIDGGGLTLERLAALGPGSVVAIPDAGGGVLPVRLLAGGKRVAAGELVAIGDGYGVLITAVSPPAAKG